jgi:hypothetical protein
MTIVELPESTCSFITAIGLPCKDKGVEKLEIPVAGRGTFKGHLCAYHVYMFLRFQPHDVIMLINKNRLIGEWS